MKIRIEAADQKAGMTLTELEEACAKARQAGCVHVSRITGGWGGQLRAIEFTDQAPKTAD